MGSAAATAAVRRASRRTRARPDTPAGEWSPAPPVDREGAVHCARGGRAPQSQLLRSGSDRKARKPATPSGRSPDRIPAISQFHRPTRSIKKPGLERESATVPDPNAFSSRPVTLPRKLPLVRLRHPVSVTDKIVPDEGGTRGASSQSRPRRAMSEPTL